MRRPSGIAVGLCPSGVAAGLGWSISSSLLISPLVCLLLPSFKGSLGPGFGPAMAQLLLCRVHNYIWPWMLHGSAPRGRNAHEIILSSLWPGYWRADCTIIYGPGCCMAAPHGDGMLAKKIRAPVAPLWTPLYMARDAAWQRPTGTGCSRNCCGPVLCRLLLSWVHSFVVIHFH